MHNNKNVQRVKQQLTEEGLNHKIVYLPNSARTAEEAAEAIHCTVEQIAKSIVCQGKGTRKPYLIIASGVNRMNEDNISQEVNEPVKRASADDVRDLTGFVIGGVAPIGHTRALKVFIDEDLLDHKKIWAAAGHPKAVFELTPDDLKKLTKGKVISVK